MKNSIWHLSLVLFTGICLGNTISTRCYGQDSQSVPATAATKEQSVPETGHTDQPQGAQTTEAAPAAQGGHRVIFLGTPPEGYVAPSEEVERYMYFFDMLRSWDASAKDYEKAGNQGWAEHWRTKLARESGLTEEQEDQVKQIASQYRQDEQAWQLKTDEEGRKFRATFFTMPRPNPNQKFVITPEQAALRQEHWDLVNKAIAQLVSTLGSRSFSRLDLYTRHMDDRMKAQQAPRKTAEGSQGGVK